MDSTCETVLQFLEKGTPLVMVTMMDRSGSVPRTAGARMLVRSNGGIWGTVGGGRYEAEAIALAMRLLEEAQRASEDGRTMGSRGAVLEFSLRGVTDMDMICGGALSLLLQVLPCDPEVSGMFKAGWKAEREARPFVLVSRICRDEDVAGISQAGMPAGAPVSGLEAGKEIPVRVERSLCFPENGVTLPGNGGSEKLPEAILGLAEQLHSMIPSYREMEGKGYLLELFPRPFRIIIFGGGHVSRELAQLCLGVDFPVTVFDDRPEFANSERFPGSDVRVPPGLAEKDAAACLEKLGIGPRDGIVIVTRGHAHDRDVLAAALETGAGYIGMIGSKSKRMAVYASLRDAGVSAERLDFVHSPIGLAIGADTPQEIAVSIAAELIQWRKQARDAEEVSAAAPAAGKNCPA